jgi:hypothetical protein
MYQLNEMCTKISLVDQRPPVATSVDAEDPLPRFFLLLVSFVCWLRSTRVAVCFHRSVALLAIAFWLLHRENSLELR